MKRHMPLYLQIVVGLAFGVLAGVVLPTHIAEVLSVAAQVIVRLLGAVAPPLILLAVMRALIRTQVQRGWRAGSFFCSL